LPEAKEYRARNDRRAANTDRDPRTWARSDVLREGPFCFDSSGSVDRGTSCLNFGIDLCALSRLNRRTQDIDSALDVLSICRLWSRFEITLIGLEGRLVAPHPVGHRGYVVEKVGTACQFVGSLKAGQRGFELSVCVRARAHGKRLFCFGDSRFARLRALRMNARRGNQARKCNR
jgi:hypothetical protein